MTTKTQSPTKSIIARLAANDPPLSFEHHGGELAPWLAAAQVGGFELPPEVLAVAEAGLHLAQQRAALVRPEPHKPQDVHALIGGASPAEVLRADAAHAEASARYQRESELLAHAERAWEANEADAFNAHRDGLITQQLRAALAALLGEAAEPARKLAQYGPDYPRGLVDRGTETELKLWRDSRHLQHDLEVLQNAWLVSFGRQCVRGKEPGVGFRPKRPGGWFVWVEPEQVIDHDLRMGIDNEVLRIANAPSQYRLLAPSEVPALLKRINAIHPPTETASGSTRLRADMCV